MCPVLNRARIKKPDSCRETLVPHVGWRDYDVPLGNNGHSYGYRSPSEDDTSPARWERCTPTRSVALDNFLRLHRANGVTFEKESRRGSDQNQERRQNSPHGSFESSRVPDHGKRVIVRTSLGRTSTLLTPIDAGGYSSKKP